MTYLEKLQKAKTEDDFFDVLFNFETDVKHCVFSKDELDIREWLGKEVNEKETICKSIAQLLFMLGRK